MSCRQTGSNVLCLWGADGELPVDIDITTPRAQRLAARQAQLFCSKGNFDHHVMLEACPKRLGEVLDACGPCAPDLKSPGRVKAPFSQSGVEQGHTQGSLAGQPRAGLQDVADADLVPVTPRAVLKHLQQPSSLTGCTSACTTGTHAGMPGGAQKLSAQAGPGPKGGALPVRTPLPVVTAVVQSCEGQPDDGLVKAEVAVVSQDLPSALRLRIKVAPARDEDGAGIASLRGARLSAMLFKACAPCACWSRDHNVVVCTQKREHH